MNRYWNFKGERKVGLVIEFVVLAFDVTELCIYTEDFEDNWLILNPVYQKLKGLSRNTLDRKAEIEVEVPAANCLDFQVKRCSQNLAKGSSLGIYFKVRDEAMKEKRLAR